MGTDSTSGEAYRLILAIDRRVIIAGDRSYSRYEEAQAKVADAVRHYGLIGDVTAVALQQGRPSHAMNGNTPPPRDRQPHDYVWTIEKRWGREVVQRILSQHQIASPTLPPTGLRNGVATTRPASIAHAPASNRRKHHKYTRWHALAAAAAVALAMATLLFLQTGGSPVHLLTTLTSPRETVKNDLPFDARTSFPCTPRREDEPVRDN